MKEVVWIHRGENREEAEIKHAVEKTFGVKVV
jgi:ribosomal protein L23